MNTAVLIDIIEGPLLADDCLLPAAAMGSSLPTLFTKRAGQIRCNRWSDRMQTPGQVQCKQVVSTDAIRWSSGVQFRTDAALDSG